MFIVDVQARVVGACARQNTLQLPFGAHQTVDACGGVRRWTFVTPGDREKKTCLESITDKSNPISSVTGLIFSRWVGVGDVLCWTIFG